MKRVSTHQDTLKVAIREKELTCEYQTGTPKTGRSRRDSQNLPICDTVYYRLVHNTYSPNDIKRVKNGVGSLINMRGGGQHFENLESLLYLFRSTLLISLSYYDL